MFLDSFRWSILFPFALFLFMDISFLTLNRQFFENQVMEIQRSGITMNYRAAGLAYLLLIFALYWFILRRKASVLDAAILGGVINGAYELTNMALLKKWQWATVALDTSWGAFLWAFVTFMTYRLWRL